MIHRIVGLLALSLAVCWSNALAQRWEIAANAGYMFGGNFKGVQYTVGDDAFIEDLKLKAAPAFGALVDFSFTENVQLEGLARLQPTELQVKSSGEKLESLWINYYHAGFLFKIPSHWNPFAAITGGATHFLPKGDVESELRGSLGVAFGAKTFFNEIWGVRLEGRFWGTYIKDSDSIYCSPPGSDNCYAYTSSIFMNQIDLTAGVVARF
ncbi:MAG: outer membrane beta-barrel protein [Gemmatimonadota bacterium]|nr:MAG: outer membrane beta-barrel protein [Gemmatimonadota bacterium]